MTAVQSARNSPLLPNAIRWPHLDLYASLSCISKMKSLLIAAIFLASYISNPYRTRAETLAGDSAQPPHIIFILADDLGPGDVGFSGGKIVPTPNIDKIAKEGVVFTQYYSAAPICSPSRCGLITGQFPARWNIHSYLQTRAGHSRDEAEHGGRLSFYACQRFQLVLYGMSGASCGRRTDKAEPAGPVCPDRPRIEIRPGTAGNRNC